MTTAVEFKQNHFLEKHGKEEGLFGQEGAKGLLGNLTKSTGLVDLSKTIAVPELSKAANLTELQNQIKDQVTKELCKNCVDHHNDMASEKSLLPEIPTPVENAANITSKTIENKIKENALNNIDQKEIIENKENDEKSQGNIDFEFSAAPTLPKLDFPQKNGNLHSSMSVDSLGSLNAMNPLNILKSDLVQPIVAYMETMLEKAYEKLKEAFKYFAGRPYLTMPLLVAVMTILTPVFLFILFAFTTTAVSFIGFLIAEGTVLLMGGIVLVAFLVSFFSVLLLFITTFGVTYVGIKSLRVGKGEEAQN